MVLFKELIIYDRYSLHNASFGLRQFHVGIAQGATAFAMLLGGLGIQLFRKWLNVKNSPIWMALVSSAILIFYIALYFESMIGFIIFTFGFMAILFISTCINIFVFSLIQEESPSHLTGKVIGILVATIGGLTPLGLRGIGMMFRNFLILFGVLMISSGVAKLSLGKRNQEVRKHSIYLLHHKAIVSVCRVGLATTNFYYHYENL